jgi:L-ascorbate metabolism protein UlaG (beta-lactamase superfamily)
LASEPKEGSTQVQTTLGLDVLNLHHGRDRSGRYPPVENLGFIIQLGGWRILHVGDTEITSDEFEAYAQSLGRIDVAMIPTWFLMGKSWESVEQWRSVVEAAVSPRYIILIHLAPNWKTASAQASRRNWVEEIQKNYPEAMAYSEPLESKVIAARPSHGSG